MFSCFAQFIILFLQHRSLWFCCRNSSSNISPSSKFKVKKRTHFHNEKIRSPSHQIFSLIWLLCLLVRSNAEVKMNMLKIFYFKQGVFRWFSPLSLSKSSLTSFTLLPALFLSVALWPWQVDMLKEMSVYVNTRSTPFSSLQKQSEFRSCVFLTAFSVPSQAVSLSLPAGSPLQRETLPHR